MSWSDLLAVLPQAAMAGAACTVFVADILMKDKRALVYIASGLMIVPLMLSIGLWLGWFGSMGDAFGGTISSDRFASFFHILIVGITAATILASSKYMEKLRGYEGEALALILFVATGMMLLVASREFITAYVSFELAALPFIGLTILHRNKASIESGLKFLVLSGLGSAFLLMGIVLIYGYTGTTFFAEIFSSLERIADSDAGFGRVPLAAGAIMITAGLAFKMSVAPWQMWVPDVYQGAPTPVAAYLSTASKASAFALILRIVYTAVPLEIPFSSDWSLVFAILAAVSMTYGNLGALSQRNIKRLMGYSTIAQAGYILTGVAAVSVLASDGAAAAGPRSVLYYLVGYAFTNLAVFFAIMAIANRTGSNSINSFAGAGKHSPLMAGVMTVGLLSLVGVPPTVGFFSKVAVFGAAINADILWLAIVGLVNSVISAYYYLRIIGKMFFEESKEEIPYAKIGNSILIPSIIAAVGAILLGVLPFLLFEFAQRSIISIL